MKYIDAHSHIAGSEFDADRDEVCVQMEAAGVGTITIGVDLESSRQAVLCAETYENVWATVGLHPLDNKTEVFDRESYAKLVMHPRVVGVGECGLDYYRSEKQEAGIKQEQKSRFVEQVEFALTHNKPLMIHGRPSRGTMDAYEEMLSTLNSYSLTHSPRLRGNVHFFVGTPDIAKAFLELGFTLSFSGVVTFAREYDDTVRCVPSDMIFAETDSPYVAPVPHRGKRNDPRNVLLIVESLARIRGENPQKLAECMVHNARRVFGI